MTLFSCLLHFYVVLMRLQHGMVFAIFALRHLEICDFIDSHVCRVSEFFFYVCVCCMKFSELYEMITEPFFFFKERSPPHPETACCSSAITLNQLFTLKHQALYNSDNEDKAHLEHPGRHLTCFILDLNFQVQVPNTPLKVSIWFCWLSFAIYVSNGTSQISGCVYIHRTNEMLQVNTLHNAHQKKPRPKKPQSE